MTVPSLRSGEFPSCPTTAVMNSQLSRLRSCRRNGATDGKLGDRSPNRGTWSSRSCGSRSPCRGVMTEGRLSSVPNPLLLPNPEGRAPATGGPRSTSRLRSKAKRSCSSSSSSVWSDSSTRGGGGRSSGSAPVFSGSAPISKNGLRQELKKKKLTEYHGAQC